MHIYLYRGIRIRIRIKMSARIRNATVLDASFHFPQDLIIEILLRLPVKSLLRFATVCKTWRALIKSPEFVCKHMKQSTQNPYLNSKTLLVVSSNCETREITMSLHSENMAASAPVGLDFPFLGERDYLEIVGVCNGLVCVSFSEFELDLVICNPSTGRFSRIPNWESWDAECLLNGEAAFGFAFDPYSDDHKLINLVRYIDEENEFREKAMAYTMGTGSWREIDIAQPIDDELRLREYSAFAMIDGVLYWECYKFPLFDAVILSFDMSDESFGVLSAPYGLDGLWKDLYWKAVQLKEELAIFLFPNERSFFVWTLNANSVDWSLKFALGWVPVIARPFEEIGVIKFAGRGENGDVIYEDRTSGDVKLFSYDLSSGEVKRLPFGQIGYYYQVNGYTESLLAVKKND